MSEFDVRLHLLGIVLFIVPLLGLKYTSGRGAISLISNSENLKKNDVKYPKDEVLLSYISNLKALPTGIESKIDSVMTHSKLEVASYLDEFGNQVHLNFRDSKSKRAYLCTVFQDGRHRDLLLFSIDDKTFVSVEYDTVISIHDRTITIAKRIDKQDFKTQSFPLR
jgi:hypothetical protein